MITANPTTASHEDAVKKPASRAPKKRRSTLEKLTPEDMQTLRLDERSHAEFDSVAQRFSRSRSDLQTFEGQGIASMGEARYDRLSAAEGQQHNDGMAVVHFLAPRILRLRDGAAKRKWRSFLAKFRKDEKLN